MGNGLGCLYIIRGVFKEKHRIKLYLFQPTWLVKLVIQAIVKANSTFNMLLPLRTRHA